MNGEVTSFSLLFSAQTAVFLLRKSSARRDNRVLLLFLLDDDDDDDEDTDTNDKEEEDTIIVVGSREVYRAYVFISLLNVFTALKSDGISPRGNALSTHYKRRGFYL